MRIQLQAPETRNWLLRADSLNDPDTWSRFVPCPHDCDRFVFDAAVVEEANKFGVAIHQCKDLLVLGSSAWEYDWNAEPDRILDHAMRVGELLGVDTQ